MPAARTTAPAGMEALELQVRGLMGGHSGVNIHEGRGNSVIFLAQLLAALLDKVPGVRVAQLAGGDKRRGAGPWQRVQLPARC